MRRKPLALILVFLVVLASLLAGCKRSAIPPVDLEILGEDETAAAMQEALNNTEGQQGSPQATDAPPAEQAGEEPAPGEAAEPTEGAVTTEPTPAEPAPAQTTAPQENPPAPVSGQATSHVVQPGETLFRIAARYNTTVSALAQANNITNQNMLSVGQTLVIPAATDGGAAAPVATGSCSTTYVVRAGDNLFRIALRYNYSQAYLAQANGISNPAMIRVGQVICIP
jgi:LysM repeat protein